MRELGALPGGQVPENWILGGSRGDPFTLKIAPWVHSLRSAHARRPAYTLRQCLLLHQTLETQFCRSYLPGRGQGTPGTQVRGPKGTQGHPEGPKKSQGDPRGPKGAFGALGGNGPMGPFGGYSEAISNGKPISNGRSFRLEGHSEWKVISDEN